MHQGEKDDRRDHLEYFIVTNNIAVKKDFNNVLFIEGTFEDVLIKVRDLVHQGVELISHPLGASISMLFSPCRSIIVGEKKDVINSYHIEAIENSIINYRNTNKGRKVNMKNVDDYALIDAELLKTALKTFQDINSNKLPKLFGGDSFETGA